MTRMIRERSLDDKPYVVSEPAGQSVGNLLLDLLKGASTLNFAWKQQLAYSDWLVPVATSAYAAWHVEPNRGRSGKSPLERFPSRQGYPGRR